MSALYAKQVEWKKGSTQRAKDGAADTGEDLTFQPVFYTSKDTSRQFKVTEKVGALTGECRCGEPQQLWLGGGRARGGVCIACSPSIATLAYSYPFPPPLPFSL
jgi:hypothetical protein